MKNINLLTKVSLVSIITIGIAIYLYQNATQQVPSNKTTNQTWVKEHSPIMGPKEAPVTLVEFIDPACEACRAMYPYVKEIMSRYPTEVRLVIRYVDFHKQSEDAIRILEAARKQNQFQNTLEVLLAFQPAWAPHGREGADPWEFLAQTKLDIKQAKKDAQDPAIQNIIEMDMADVKAAGVKKTPSFFVNGKPLKLMHPDPLIEMIQAELNALKIPVKPQENTKEN